MRKLIAVYPVLFESVKYVPGDELPTMNSGYTAAWIENGTAEWQEETGEQKPKAKAKMVTAQPGLEGKAEPPTGSEPDLIGKVPSGKARGEQPESKKKARKSHE